MASKQDIVVNRGASRWRSRRAGINTAVFSTVRLRQEQSRIRAKPRRRVRWLFRPLPNAAF